MRSYEDIANRIMKRGDEIIEQRRLRAVKIKHTSYAVSGMCAAVIAGVGMWKLSSAKDIGNDKFSGSSMIENFTEPTTSETITETKTTYVTTAAVTSAVKTTSSHVTTQTTLLGTAAAETTAVSGTTAANTTKATPQTTTGATAVTEAPTAVGTTAVTTTTPESITEPPAITTAPTSPTSTVPTVFSEIFIESHEELASPEPAGTNYKFVSYNSSDRMTGSYIRSAHIEREYTENGMAKTAAADIEIYSVSRLPNTNAMIAVKFADRTGTYIYVKSDYSPLYLGGLINDMGLNADGLTGTAYAASGLHKNIDKDSIWTLLTADKSLPDIYSAEAKNGSVAQIYYWTGYVSGSFGVSESGQLWCELCGVRSCYDIGEGRAKAVISVITGEND
ncbi:hypothetical protein [Ruminococcus sp.]|uniref:hypothetical protein n=1 Tax=Ruminococcus sp. TaxID=41978 RepID=UPI002BC3B0B2|nr:hypothetical protein [Ruminococcus sp.]HNZ98427.1 hypothetical protein [Ruminococcus sp.]HOH85759.1 hypothetical protein [Ruminococcus sp.]